MPHELALGGDAFVFGAALDMLPVETCGGTANDENTKEQQRNG